ncbi:MAG: ArsR family transcriptional regulator, partial [Halobacteriota archaeon]|nr:ArsR family transcriptional regulator [Halobacteriota archaeon]
MLKSLIKKENHISGLARDVGVSVPVASKHVDVLERA